MRRCLFTLALMMGMAVVALAVARPMYVAVLVWMDSHIAGRKMLADLAKWILNRRPALRSEARAWASHDQLADQPTRRKMRRPSMVAASQSTVRSDRIPIRSQLVLTRELPPQLHTDSIRQVFVLAFAGDRLLIAQTTSDHKYLPHAVVDRDEAVPEAARRAAYIATGVQLGVVEILGFYVHDTAVYDPSSGSVPAQESGELTYDIYCWSAIDSLPAQDVAARTEYILLGPDVAHSLACVAEYQSLYETALREGRTTAETQPDQISAACLPTNVVTATQQPAGEVRHTHEALASRRGR